MNEDRTLQVLAIEYEALRAEILMCATTAINLFRLARGRRALIGMQMRTNKAHRLRRRAAAAASAWCGFGCAL